MKLAAALIISLAALPAQAQAPAPKVDGISKAHKANQAHKSHKAQKAQKSQKLDGLNKDRKAAAIKGESMKARQGMK